jgi:hypothetical protein
VVYLKVRDDVIQDAAYFSDSLGGLIHAYGSVLTEMVKGKTIREALWIRPQNISRALQRSETGYVDWFKKPLVEAINNYNVYRSAPWEKPYERSANVQGSSSLFQIFSDVPFRLLSNKLTTVRHSGSTYSPAFSLRLLWRNILAPGPYRHSLLSGLPNHRSFVWKTRHPSHR